MLKNHITYSDIQTIVSVHRTSGSGSGQNVRLIIRTGFRYEVFVQISDLSEPEFLPPLITNWNASMPTFEGQQTGKLILIIYFRATGVDKAMRLGNLQLSIETPSIFMLRRFNRSQGSSKWRIQFSLISSTLIKNMNTSLLSNSSNTWFTKCELS